MNILLSKFEKGMFLVEEKIKKIINEDTKVLIIPWSFAKECSPSEFDDFYNAKIKPKYEKVFLNLGVKKKSIKHLDCYRDSRNKMIKKIKESNILVLTGGNPELFYNKVVQDFDLLYEIKYYNGVIIGSSAGAELQLKNYFITAENNYYKYMAFYPGFGCIKKNFYFDVHSLNDKDYLNRLELIALEKKKKVYAIFDDGAIIVDDDEITKLGNVMEF